jgi:filamentous hemagglutinin family protein
MEPSQRLNPMRKSEAATRAARGAVALVAAALLVLPPSVAFAAPQGAQVQHGSASFETQGSTTVIRTSTPVTIIDYKSFDIGRSEAVHIHQPNAASRVMNKVLPTDPTRIDGELWSNGQVYILNAAGIFFGNDAVVDVGRLVAAAGSLSNADFIAGVDHFTDLSGAVGNDGVIEADSVTLIGRTVANHGTIHAEDGMIALVAGEEVILSKIEGRVIVRVDGPSEDAGEFAVQQTGTLDAGRGRVSLTAGDTWSLAINHTGITRGRDIRLEAGSGVVQVAGVLDAANLGANGVGGRIEVTGEKVAIGDALLDASGEAGGGEIHVGGDVGGAGPLANARRTYVSPDAVLRADAGGTGDGGEIVVWSDEWTVFRGAASARGGASGGDGGFVEISGHALEATGEVDLAAPAGRGGTLLYDPERIEIRGGESEIEGTTAELMILEAEKSVTATGTFDGSDVQLAEEVILSIGTLGSADDLTGADDLRGIDLSLESQDLVWKAGAGGAIVLVTGADGSNEADIRAHRLEARGPPTGGGASIFLAASGGDVEIDQIDTSADVDPDGAGPRRAGGEGGTVTIFTSGADRDVRIGSIETARRGVLGHAGGQRRERAHPAHRGRSSHRAGDRRPCRHQRRQRHRRGVGVRGRPGVGFRRQRRSDHDRRPGRRHPARRPDGRVRHGDPRQRRRGLDGRPP